MQKTVTYLFAAFLVAVGVAVVHSVVAKVAAAFAQLPG